VDCFISQAVGSPGYYFPAGANRRHFRGLGGAPDTICGRDGFTRDFGCSRYENLSGAISWLTFFLGRSQQPTSGEAKVITREARVGARKFTKH